MYQLQYFKYMYIKCINDNITNTCTLNVSSTLPQIYVHQMYQSQYYQYMYIKCINHNIANRQIHVHQIYQALDYKVMYIKWSITIIQLQVHQKHQQYKNISGEYNFSPDIWTASSEFGTYRLCEQRRFRRACASAQSRQNLRCSLIEALSQEEPSDRKPDPWPLWMAGHAQLKCVMTECSKTQIRLTGLIWNQTINNRHIKQP